MLSFEVVGVLPCNCKGPATRADLHAAHPCSRVATLQADVDGGCECCIPYSQDEAQGIGDHTSTSSITSTEREPNASHLVVSGSSRHRKIPDAGSDVFLCFRPTIARPNDLVVRMMSTISLCGQPVPTCNPKALARCHSYHRGESTRV